MYLVIFRIFDKVFNYIFQASITKRMGTKWISFHGTRLHYHYHSSASSFPFISSTSSSPSPSTSSSPSSWRRSNFVTTGGGLPGSVSPTTCCLLLYLLFPPPYFVWLGFNFWPHWFAVYSVFVISIWSQFYFAVSSLQRITFKSEPFSKPSLSSGVVIISFSRSTVSLWWPLLFL